MKLPYSWSVVTLLAIIFLFSCEEENHCDTTEYAQPEISFVDPEDGEILMPYTWNPPQVSLHLSAEAGLNILKLEDQWGYEMPLAVFLDGETDLVYTFTLEYVAEGSNIFVIYDRCNQRSELTGNVVYEPAP